MLIRVQQQRQQCRRMIELVASLLPLAFPCPLALPTQTPHCTTSSPMAPIQVIDQSGARGRSARAARMRSSVELAGSAVDARQESRSEADDIRSLATVFAAYAPAKVNRRGPRSHRHRLLRRYKSCSSLPLAPHPLVDGHNHRLLLARFDSNQISTRRPSYACLPHGLHGSR